MIHLAVAIPAWELVSIKYLTAADTQSVGWAFLPVTKT